MMKKAGPHLAGEFRGRGAAGKGTPATPDILDLLGGGKNEILTDREQHAISPTRLAS